MALAPIQSLAFARAKHACDDALRTAGDERVERDFVFAGERVRMRSAGKELAHHLSRPFAHLAVATDDNAPVALTIDVWDERQTYVAYPSVGDFDASEKTWGCGHGTMNVSDDTAFIRYDCSSWVTWFDRANRHIVGWRANANRLSMHERTRPLPFLLPVWYADRSVHIVHAGLIARGETGVLLCGSGGAGKSTTSLACLGAGLDFLSDDHVGLQETANGFNGHSVFASTRLEPSHLHRNFPSLIPHAIQSFDWGEPKSLVLVAEIMPERVRRVAPISAIALPTIVDKPSSRLQKASRAEALRALAPSTLMQMPFGATAERFEKMTRLAMTVPAYRLELGRDISAIAPSVNELIDQIS